MKKLIAIIALITFIGYGSAYGMEALRSKRSIADQRLLDRLSAKETKLEIENKNLKKEVEFLRGEVERLILENQQLAWQLAFERQRVAELMAENAELTEFYNNNAFSAVRWFTRGMGVGAFTSQHVPFGEYLSYTIALWEIWWPYTVGLVGSYIQEIWYDFTNWNYWPWNW